MPRYDAFLLRVWRGETVDGARWSSRLEHLPDGQHQRFDNLDALLAHLRTALAEMQSASPARARGRNRS